MKYNNVQLSEVVISWTIFFWLMANFQLARSDLIFNHRLINIIVSNYIPLLSYLIEQRHKKEKIYYTSITTYVFFSNKKGNDTWGYTRHWVFFQR